jgi:hypothetical protein
MTINLFNFAPPEYFNGSQTMPPIQTSEPVYTVIVQNIPPIAIVMIVVFCLTVGVCFGFWIGKRRSHPK